MKHAAALPDHQHMEFSSLETAPFPAPVRDEFRVYFEEEAYAAMKTHASTTNEVELGGILAGSAKQDVRGPYLHITGALPAEAARNRDTQITFTHEAWHQINQVMDARYPGKSIVGWYHTHPGFGIFLSEMDLFIQHNFFSQPFQVAVVLETKSGEEGCFVWQEGQPQPLRRYWAGTKEVPLSGARDAAPAPREGAPAAARDRQSIDQPRVSFMLLMPTVVLLVLILAATYGVTKALPIFLGQHEALNSIGLVLQRMNEAQQKKALEISTSLEALQSDLRQLRGQAVDQGDALEQHLKRLLERVDISAASLPPASPPAVEASGSAQAQPPVDTEAASGSSPVAGGPAATEAAGAAPAQDAAPLEQTEETPPPGDQP